MSHDKEAHTAAGAQHSDSTHGPASAAHEPSADTFDPILARGDVGEMAAALVAGGDFVAPELMRRIQERYGNAVAAEVTQAASNPAAFIASVGTKAKPRSFGEHAAEGAAHDNLARTSHPMEGHVEAGLGSGSASGTIDGGFAEPSLEDVGQVLLSNPFTLPRSVSRVLYGPLFDRMRQRDMVRNVLGGDQDPIRDKLADTAADFADDPLFASGFMGGAVSGGYRATRDFVYAPVDMAKQLVGLVKTRLLEGDLGLLKKLGRELDQAIKAAPALAAAFVDEWTNPASLSRGLFQGRVVGYCVTTIALTIAAAYEGPLALAPEYAGFFRAVKSLDTMGTVAEMFRPAAAGAKVERAAEDVAHLGEGARVHEPKAPATADGAAPRGEASPIAPAGANRGEHTFGEVLGVASDDATAARPPGTITERGAAREPQTLAELQGLAPGSTASAVANLPGVAPGSGLSRAFLDLEARALNGTVRFFTSVGELLRAAANGLIELAEPVLQALRRLARRMQGPQLATAGAGALDHTLLDVEAAASDAWRAGERPRLQAIEARSLGGEGDALTQHLGEGPESRGMHEIDPMGQQPHQQRLPVAKEIDPSVAPEAASSGFWADENARGNTDWYSDNQKVNEITGYKPIRFENGYPILDPYAVETVYLDRMVGSEADFVPADIEFARRRGQFKANGEPNQAWAARYRAANKLTWHHNQDLSRMQLVPTQLHENIPHAGGASLARSGR